MIELDQELIRRSDNQSMYNRGTHIQEDAEIDYRKFVEHYSNRQLNDKQLEIFGILILQFFLNPHLIMSCNELLTTPQQGQ